MAKLITNCPSCNSGNVHVTKIECDSCGTKFEGEFEVPKLLKLSSEDLQFVEQFLLASGSLKDMAKQLGVSYPTIRNRLNNVIEEIAKMAKSSKTEREKVLQALEKGTITAKEAARKLSEV
ncbi:MAG: DUF2089 family protein [Bdellovibrio sp.]